MLTQMEKINNRRKAVVWVSNGYDFNPFAESRLGEDPVFGGRFGQTREEGRQQQGMTNQNQFADADLARELAELTRTANRANATLYTIDPRGLVAGSDLDEQLDPVEFGEHVRKTQDSLRVLAEQTGGIAVVNQNNFEKALKRIDAETSLAELTVDTVRQFGRLEPFGQANPPVQLLIRRVRQQRPPQRLGKEQQHLKMWVRDSSRMVHPALWWNCRSADLPTGDFDLVCQPEINTFQERDSVQLKLVDWKLPS